MTKATPPGGDPADPRSTNSSSPRDHTPAFNLHAVVPRELCDEVAALIAEAEALESQVGDFAVRCFRAITRVQAAEIEADDAQGLGDAGLMLVEERSGVSRLTGIVEAMVDDLDVARVEVPGSLPDWAAAEIHAVRWLPGMDAMRARGARRRES